MNKLHPRWQNLIALAVATLAALAALVMATHAHGAGAVKVQFIESEKFADAGETAYDRERHLRSLREHMVATWSSRLPDGQTLELEVLELDLAGIVWPGSARDMRIVSGRADAPSATLRWSLKTGDGRVLQSGTGRIVDLAYFDTAAWLHRNPGDLPYEKRLLDRWFSSQIATTGTAAPR